MKNGLALFYIKDDTVYPVILSKEQDEMLQMLGNVITGGEPLRVYEKPLGTAYDLAERMREDKKHVK